MANQDTRQQRRARQRAAETRRQTFDRVHGNVLEGRTVRDLWLVYGRERLESTGLSLAEPAIVETVEHAFYAGAASMLELMQRVAPENVSEEAGVEMLSRLQEELEAYTDRGTH